MKMLNIIIKKYVKQYNEVTYVLYLFLYKSINKYIINNTLAFTIVYLMH